MSVCSSVFSAEECLFIASHLDDWARLSGAGKVRDSDGDLYSPKERFVDEIKEDFFQRFLECKLSNDHNNGTAFSIVDRDRLHSRIKQILYNEAAKYNKRNTSAIGRPPMGKKTAFYSLFKPRFSANILQQRDRLATGNTQQDLLNAYNTAVAEELKHQEQHSPAVI
ncbi:hypothetical protein FRC09_002439 [Ceratobasidium sp. 395]|nr:hypothetical protein FRC09_002439 [Ceratobasidium sp. 395]